MLNVCANVFRTELVGAWNTLSSQVLNAVCNSAFKTSIGKIRWEVFPLLERPDKLM